MKFDAVLSLLLGLVQPGESAYSAVPERPGVVCDTQRTDGCRRETYLEGLRRYLVIARSVAAAAKDDQTTRAVLTVLYHESGLRLDVHRGTGKWARGDQGRSFCLGQILKGKGSEDGERLTGVSRKATDRCVAAVVRHLGTKPIRDPYSRFASYGGVWAKGDRRITSRVHTFNRLAGPVPKLGAAVRRALGLGSRSAAATGAASRSEPAAR